MVIRNTVLATVAQIVLTLLSIGLASQVVNSSGIEAYSVVAIALLFSYRGVLPGLMCGLQDYLIFRDAGNRDSVILQTLAPIALLSLVLTLISIAVLEFFEDWFLQLLVVMPSLMIQFFAIILRARISALQRIWLTRLIDIITFALFCIFVLSGETDIKSLFLFLTGMASLEILLSVCYFRIFNFEKLVLVKSSGHSQNWAGYRNFLIRSGGVLLGSHGDRLIIITIAGSEAYAFYDILLRIPKLLKTLISVIQSVLYPWARLLIQSSGSSSGSMLQVIEGKLFYCTFAAGLFFLANITWINKVIYGSFATQMNASQELVVWMMLLMSMTGIPYSFLIAQDKVAKVLTLYTITFTAMRASFGVIALLVDGLHAFVVVSALIALVSWLFVQITFLNHQSSRPEFIRRLVLMSVAGSISYMGFYQSDIFSLLISLFAVVLGAIYLFKFKHENFTL
jgi:O-antigen/teichoic acid export membrane protein